MAIPLPPVLKEAFERARTMDASLTERLDYFAGAVGSFNPMFTEAVDRMVSGLKLHGAGLNSPNVGDPMPPFILPDDQGRLVSLEELLRWGPVALAFHRGHWCPYCRISTSALAKANDAANVVGGQIAAITPERQMLTMELKKDAGASFPILTDMDNAYAMSLNLAISLGEEMTGTLQRHGLDFPAYQGNDAWLLPIPATFIVGRDGLVKARFVDPDYRRRMPIEELLAALQIADRR